MKKVLVLSVVILQLLFIGAGSLYSQSPAGKWVDSKQNITLILNGDFTYSLVYQNGSSTGYWSSGSGQFCLRDASATTPVCYTVISYSASAMVLRDINGVMLNYRKMTGDTPVRPGTQPVTKRRVKGANRVIAVKGNKKLTHGNLRTGIDLTQFIIGQKIKDKEVRELKQKLVEEFNLAPVQTIGQLEGIEKSIIKIHNATDPVKIGQVRQQIFAAFYKLTRHMKEEQKPLMIRVINRYIQVLAFDEANNLILTNKDVDGYMNYMIFNSELAGQKIDAGYAVRRAVSAQLVSNFASMPVGQKQMLASASLIWQLTEWNWKRLNQTQKNQYIMAYRNQISSNFKQSSRGSGYGQQWKPPQGNQKKSLSQMKRDFNAKQNMFRMMQNMNTNSHALSLNIIENIGGTGNYWEVTDYNNY
ncbi:MAG: hypothetical protein ABFR36_04200 [Acidobacteriota bacterium]